MSEGTMTFGDLVSAIERTSAELTRQAKQAVNVSLTLRNWLIGSYLAEYELKGSDRAEYGEELLATLSRKLRVLKVRATGHRQLYVLPETGSLISRSVTAKSQAPDRAQLLSSLSYTHLEQLVRLDSEEKRRFYQDQCMKAGWSVRELKRQRASLYYERTALSTDRAQLERQTLGKGEPEPPDFPLRDPYVFEFLGLKPAEVRENPSWRTPSWTGCRSSCSSSVTASASRPARSVCSSATATTSWTWSSITACKCHVLIELKVDKFSHEHIGQLNTYVSWFADHEMTDGDSPPVGLLLCTEKDHTVVKYALAGMSNQLFVSKYQVALPSEAQLQGALAGVVG